MTSVEELIGLLQGVENKKLPVMIDGQYGYRHVEFVAISKEDGVPLRLVLGE